MTAVGSNEAMRSMKDVRVVFASALCGVALIAQQGTQQGNGLELRPDPQCVVANSLVGSWKLDENLTKRLGHRGGEARLEFRVAPEVLAKVPAKLAKRLQEFRILLAGTMKKADKEHAFLVTTQSGNATIVWFREQGADPLGAVESWNVALVRAAAKQADLLFVGGNHDDQSFAAYAREAPVMGPQTPAAALTEMLRLLEAGKFREFVESYAAPDDMAKLAGSGIHLDQIVERLEGGQAKFLLGVFEKVVKQEPEWNAERDIATWKVDGPPARLRMQKVDGRWYLRSD